MWAIDVSFPADIAQVKCLLETAYQGERVLCDDVRRWPPEGAAARNLARPSGMDRQQLGFTCVLGAVHRNAFLEFSAQLFEPLVDLSQRLELVRALKSLSAADALWQCTLFHLLKSWDLCHFIHDLMVDLNDY